MAQIDKVSSSHIQARYPSYGSDLSYTVLNVTGKGFLIGVHSKDSSFTVQIDGGNRAYIGTSFGRSNPFFLRFNTSLKITSAEAVSRNMNYDIVLD